MRYPQDRQIAKRLYKTNSVDDPGYELTAEEIADRFRGSEQYDNWQQG